VGYAPFDEPEIVVSAFVFNGGEGSAWAAPVACHVMAAYFGVGQYADPATFVDGEPAEIACEPVSQFGGFRPQWPPLEPVNPEVFDQVFGNLYQAPAPEAEATLP
jgi:penicillin-binding protein 2